MADLATDSPIKPFDFTSSSYSNLGFGGGRGGSDFLLLLLFFVVVVVFVVAVVVALLSALVLILMLLAMVAVLFGDDGGDNATDVDDVNTEDAIGGDFNADLVFSAIELLAEVDPLIADMRLNRLFTALSYSGFLFGGNLYAFILFSLSKNIQAKRIAATTTEQIIFILSLKKRLSCYSLYIIVIMILF